MKQVKIIFNQKLLDSAPSFNSKEFVRKLNKMLKSKRVGKRVILAKGKRK
jgi:hypothetical protein